MNTWYECKVKAQKIDQGGYERAVTDVYLIDAVSYTDAEARITQKASEYTKGAFQVKSIRQSNVTEIITDGNGEWWWKAKISLITVDEELGREKKVAQYLLVSADNLAEAVVKINSGLEYMLVPYNLEQVALSPIAEVFPYFLLNDEENG